MSGPRRLQHLFAGVVPPREWLTMAQLAEHGKFMTRDGRSFSPEAARKFVTRHPALPRGYRGRQIVVDRATYDRFITAAFQVRELAALDAHGVALGRRQGREALPGSAGGDGHAIRRIVIVVVTSIWVLRSAIAWTYAASKPSRVKSLSNKGRSVPLHQREIVP